MNMFVMTTMAPAVVVRYRPVDLLAVALGVLVLTVIIRQVVGLRRRNRLAERARQARRRPVLERDDPDSWEPLLPACDLWWSGMNTTEGVRAGSRIDRLTRPRARDVVTETAVEFGVCVRPVLLRRTDLETGETLVIEVPCGSTREAACPPCADRARRLRAQQCREGWHLTEEPTLVAHPATPEQRELIRERAAATEALDHAGDTADGRRGRRDGRGAGGPGR